MAGNSDFVHISGMSENSSGYFTANTHIDLDNQEIRIEPPLGVIFEGPDALQVAVIQDSLAARYDDAELREIGGGNVLLGIQRIIGDIAMNGNLKQGAVKPLHPTMFNAEPI